MRKRPRNASSGKDGTRFRTDDFDNKVGKDWPCKTIDRKYLSRNRFERRKTNRFVSLEQFLTRNSFEREPDRPRERA